MTDIVLRDIDSVLADRIGRLAQAHGWSHPRTLLHVLEQGLHACESDGSVGLAEQEARVLQAAIQAMEHVPSDPGFALIGRAGPVPEAAPQPDQSIKPSFELE
ncbi:MAG TPA: hypothetical protein VHL61_00215 [Luteimonas sp.]|jgi:hypothetical protein|nr:hypothetical protein [Luteimonas sp.]